MSEMITIAGVDLEQVEIEGITYSYPVERIPLDHLELATDLSSAHAEGTIVGLPTDPKAYPAQGAYFLESKPRDADFVINMGNLVDERFEGLLDNIFQDERKLQTLVRFAELLENGENIVNAVPHGSLLDIGVMHGLVYAGLSRLGANFRSGIAISQGVNGLGKEFNGYMVPLSTALSWACNKIWFVTPRTENSEKSEFAQVVPKDQIDQQNRVVRFDSQKEQKDGGMLITVAPSATSYKRLASGERLLITPTLGTLKMFAHPNTHVAVAVGAIQYARRPSYELGAELTQLGGDDDAIIRQGDRILRIMTRGLNEMNGGSGFVYYEARS